MRLSTYKKIYAFAVLLTPILYQYSLFGGVLDLDVIAMLVVFVLGLIGHIKNSRRYIIDALLIIVYIIVVTSINALLGPRYSSLSNMILRTSRYCLYLFIVLIRNLDCFEYEFGMKVYRVIAYMAFIYVVIQAVFYFGFRIVLPNKIGQPVQAVIGWETEMTNARPRAFFSEPSALAYSLVPFIVCSLFGKPYMKKDRRELDAIITSLAVFISTSGQGIICVMVIWICWISYLFVQNKVTKYKLLEILFIIGIAVIFLVSPIFQIASDRILDAPGKFGAVTARTSGYKTLVLLTPLQSFFGTGYGNYITKNTYGLILPYETVFYSSAAELIFTTGIVGLLLFLGLLAKGFIRGTAVSRMIIISIGILMISGSPLSGSFIPLNLSFALCLDCTRDKYKE